MISKKIAITGANGFIASNIIDYFSKNYNYEIIKITRNNFDLNNPILSNLYDEFGNPDVLIHTAWENARDYKSLHHFETHLPAQYNFVKSLIFSGLKHIIITGTCFEYGMVNGVIKEDTPLLPITIYGMAKKMLYEQLKALQKDNNTPPFTLTWCRLFYMYGDNIQAFSSVNNIQGGGNVADNIKSNINNTIYMQFKNAVAENQSFFKMSKGEQLRDYLPVEMVAQYLAKIAIYAKYNGVINICSGQPISMRALVEKWRDELNSNISLDLGYYPYVGHEPMAFWGDNTILKNLLNETLE